MRKQKLARALIRLLRDRYGHEIKHRWYSDPFRVLISCVLSQRTREENTELANRALFGVAPTPTALASLNEKKLETLIKPVGFPKQKAKRLKEIANLLITRYGGKVPKQREELLKLPGVGPKTANVVLCYGFGVPCIPVDTHVNRISRRLGFVPENAKLEEVEPVLKSSFPKSKWCLLNRGLVLFGRDLCLPRKPKCSQCPLARMCPTGRRRHDLLPSQGASAFPSGYAFTASARGAFCGSFSPFRYYRSLL